MSTEDLGNIHPNRQHEGIVLPSESIYVEVIDKGLPLLPTWKHLPSDDDGYRSTHLRYHRIISSIVHLLNHNGCLSSIMWRHCNITIHTPCEDFCLAVLVQVVEMHLVLEAGLQFSNFA